MTSHRTSIVARSSAGTPAGATLEEVERPVRMPPPATLRRAQIAADATAVIVGHGVAFAIQGWLRPLPLAIRFDHLVLAAAVVPIWLLALGANKLYAARAVERPTEEICRLLVAGAASTGALVGLGFVLQYELLSRLIVALLFICVSTTLIVERRIARRIFAWLRATGRIRRRVVVVGTDPWAVAIAAAIDQHPSLGYEVVGFVEVDRPDERRSPGPVAVAHLDDTIAAMRHLRCCGAIVSLASIDPCRLNRLTRRLIDQGFHVAVSTGLHDIDITRIRPQELDGEALVYVEPTIRTGWRRHAKRGFDVGVAALALLVSAPVLATAAVLIKLDSRGPVLFRQLRVGLDGQLFTIVKLRTMQIDAETRRAALLEQNEADGPLFKMSCDPRVTRVGSVLRRLSIDEIPQFWNVLRGSMSIVGPRPALPAEVVDWDPDLHERLRVLPGITGMWQVSGRSATTFEEYKRLDLFYVDNWSLVHDLAIVLKTFNAVLLRRGAS
jgi:exopolysaccharide biosynthesis polyprenyl glycosylphosphotransferase